MNSTSPPLLQLTNVRVKYRKEDEQVGEGNEHLTGAINIFIERGKVYLIACDNEWIRRGLFDAFLLGKCAEGTVNAWLSNDEYFFQRIGAISRKTKLHESFTVKELISRSIQLRLKVSTDGRKEFIAELLDRWNLERVADCRYRRLNNLEKASVQLAVESVHCPALLFIHDISHFNLSSAEEIQSLFSLIYGYSHGQTNTAFVIIAPQIPLTALPFIDKISILTMGQFYYIGSLSQLDKLTAEDFNQVVAKLNYYLVNPPISEDDIKIRIEMLNSLKIDPICQGACVTEFDQSAILTPSALDRFFLLIKHQGRADFRNKPANLALFITNLIIYTLVSFIFFQLPTTEPTGLSDRAGLLYFLSVNTFFANSISMLEKFDIFRKVTRMERSFNLWNSTSFIIAQFVNLLPLRTISFVIFGTATYYITGLRTDGFQHYLVFIFTLLLLTYASATFGMLISIIMRHLDFGQLIIPFFGIYFFIFGNLSTAPNATWILRWMQYVDPIFYSFQCLIQNEVDGLSTNVTVIDNNPSLFLSKNNYDIMSVAACLPALAGFIIIFLISSIIAYHFRFKPFKRIQKTE